MLTNTVTIPSWQGRCLERRHRRRLNRVKPKFHQGAIQADIIGGGRHDPGNLSVVETKHFAENFTFSLVQISLLMPGFDQETDFVGRCRLG